MIAKVKRYKRKAYIRFTTGAIVLATGLGLSAVLVKAIDKIDATSINQKRDDKINRRITEYCTAKAAFGGETKDDNYNRRYKSCIDDNTIAPSKFFLVVPGVFSLMMSVLGFMLVRKGAAYHHLARQGGQSLYKPDPTAQPQVTISEADLTARGVVLSSGVSPLASFTLKPGETVTAEKQALAAMDGTITFASVPLYFSSGATSRIFSGEGVGRTQFTNEGTASARLVLSPPECHGVIAVALGQGESVYCRRGAFFAGQGDIKIEFNRIRNRSFATFAGLFGWQKLTGQAADNTAYIGSKGMVQSQDLGAQETLKLPHGALIAVAGPVELGVWEPDLLLSRATSAFLTTVTGPGRVWYQLPVREPAKRPGIAGKIIDLIAPG